MATALLGKKIGMTQVYDEAGTLHPVTVVQAGPCAVLQVKTLESDGYNAIQLGFDDVKPHRALKPQIGHAAKAGAKPKRFVRELRTDDVANYQLGQTLTVDVFEGVAMVDVTGVSKGKGFAGGMKRHHFGGQPASHGTERKHRSPGSLSGRATNRGYSGRMKKGRRMAGHMGAARSTKLHSRLIRTDKENNLLLIKGAVPGANGAFVYIRASR